MSSTIQIKRGTRAQLDAAALSNALNVGEPYLINDEGRMAIGTATGDFVAMARQTHNHDDADTIDGGTY